MRSAALALVLLTACSAPAELVREGDDPVDPHESTWAAGLAPLFHDAEFSDPKVETSLDDDDAVGDDDDDDIVIEPFVSPCPNADAPLPETWFADVTTCAGALASSGAIDADEITGTAWGDVDGDGDQDLYVTGFLDDSSLLLNQGDGHFELSPHNDQVALNGALTAGAVFVDYDNDGDPDLHVSCQGPDHLLRNDGEAGWVDVSEAAGLAYEGHSIMSSWGDYDADGLLDVYVVTYPCNECPWLDEDTQGVDALYRNLGDGTFDDVTDLLGAELLDGLGLAVVWMDYDDDGDSDLYVANDKGNTLAWDPEDPMNRNLMFRNDGAGCGGHCFSEVGMEIGAGLRINSMGVAVADFDGDLLLDIAVSDKGPVSLLKNLGGSFLDVTLTSGMEAATATTGWSVVFLDYDNDGDQDLYMAEGIYRPNPMLPTPNWFLANDGDGTFTEASELSGAVASLDTASVAVADYDGDGGLDIALGNRRADYQLFRNLEALELGHTWLRVRLVGGGPVSTAAVGARVYVTDTAGIVRMQEVKLGSALGASHDLALHFGLGAEDPDEVEVLWPDGTITTLDSPASNRELIVEYP
ncbi:MAG: CRTAC1 family protein [Proteobacteria bacterium]|nr:CRTAC1 family protein [Pseudomonadota bacterium]MCP4868267.1 CRTAC1 family protein [Pseudomonadota bacterium]